MRKMSPISSEVHPPLQVLARPGEPTHEPVTPRALKVAHDIAPYLGPYVARTAFAIAALPAPHERSPLYVARLGQEIHADDLVYEPKIGEVGSELPVPAVQLGLQGIDPTKEQADAENGAPNFMAMLGLYRLGESSLLRCSVSEWGGPYNADTRVAKQNSLAALFPGQDTTELAALEYINLGIINSLGEITSKRPFDERAFGSDILKIMSCGLLNASSRPLDIIISNGKVTEY